MRRIIAMMLFCFALLLVGGAWTAKADTTQPLPGCGYVSYMPWSPCYAFNPPNPSTYPGWVPIDGIPGTTGPHGYTPITGNSYFTMPKVGGYVR